MRTLKEILSDWKQRPSTEEALAYFEEDIIFHLRDSKCIDKTYLNKLVSLHESFLPILESITTFLLSEQEKYNPDYFFFERDASMIYDSFLALSLLNQNIPERTHSLKMSRLMGDEMDSMLKNYFSQEGLTRERFKKGPRFIGIDSGLEGSLFERVYSILNPPFSSTCYFYDYLICNATWAHFPVEIKVSSEIKEHFLNLFNEINFSDESVTCLNRGAYFFLESIPKFTGRYREVFQKEDSSWDVLPNKDDLLDSHENVNPPLAMILQKRTLEYFSRPEIQERIFKRVYACQTKTIKN